MSLSLLLSLALAAEPTESVKPTPPPPDDGFTFLGLVQARISQTNVVPSTPYLDGQVVGVMGGINGTTTSEEERALVAEQRVNGFFTYAPPTLDGRVGLTAGFEVDFAYGDQSYQIGGNTGGGYGADQVNLQTRRMHANYKALTGDHQLNLVLGLQFVADGVYDPANSRLDDLSRTGGGLRFFGSEAAGLSAYGLVRNDGGEQLRYRLGAYTLYEEGSGLKDDITLYMGDLQASPAYASRVGLHAWYLRDSADGLGGLFGTGPTSTLSELQGGPKLSFLNSDGTAPIVDADLFYFSIDGGYNHRLDKGRFGAGGLALLNAGRIYIEGQTDVPVMGFLASGDVRYRYMRGDGSVLSLQALWSSADDEAKSQYTGILTGNSYGIVGAVWASHGCVLLLPDPKAINRQVAVLPDVSGAGRGLMVGLVSAGYDLVPNRLNLTVGAGQASDASGTPLGTEVNVKLTGKPWLFGDVSLVAAALPVTTFDVMPWMLYSSLDWVVF